VLYTVSGLRAFNGQLRPASELVNFALYGRQTERGAALVKPADQIVNPLQADGESELPAL